MTDLGRSNPATCEMTPRPQGGLSASVRVPGSKSITNRALILAALNSGSTGCVLRGVLQSEDTEVMVNALLQLGFQFQIDWDNCTIRFVGHRDRTRALSGGASLFVANSGTSMRFLAALASLGNQPIRLDGVARMRERPIEDLLAALRALGVRAQSESGTGCPPVLVRGQGAHGWQNNRVSIRGDISSQFLSGLLMVAPWGTANQVTIEVDGPLVSVPYVEMTLKMMGDFGTPIEATASSFTAFDARQSSPAPLEYLVEPDASAASYFLAAAGILGGRVTVLGLSEESLQGDIHFVDVLEKMGCRVEKCSSGITVHGGRLQGIDIDMNAISDTVMTLGVVACFAEGPTTIRNVGHIRHKETDRIAALATELRKAGATVAEFSDGLKITPGPLRGAVIDTYDDHRMAMSMALVGLKVPGIIIRNPGCVAKTYPGFWNDLALL